MADVERIYDGVGMIPNLPDLKLTNDGRLTPLVAQTLLNAIINACAAINGKISLGSGVNYHQAGNLDAQCLEWYFKTADAEEVIPHSLKRRAVGYIIYALDRAAILYDSSRGSWDEKHLRLKCNVSTTTVAFLVF
jgi:hypothetical protein